MKLLLLTAGAFGDAVSQRLATRLAVTAIDLRDAVPRLDEWVPAHDAVGVATFRPYVDLCREVDTACHRHGIPWTVAEIGGTTLSCGPHIVPGSGAGCYHCFTARIDAHRRDGEWTRVIRQAYADDYALGPFGHTPGMVALAAAAIEGDLTGGRAAGTFRSVDVIAGNVLESQVIALHGCPRCRPRVADTDPTRRFVSALIPALRVTQP